MITAARAPSIQAARIRAWASVMSSGSSGVARMNANSAMFETATSASRNQSRPLRVTIARRSIGAHPSRPQLSTVNTTRITRIAVIVAGDGRGCLWP